MFLSVLFLFRLDGLGKMHFFTCFWNFFENIENLIRKVKVERSLENRVYYVFTLTGTCGQLDTNTYLSRTYLGTFVIFVTGVPTLSRRTQYIISEYNPSISLNKSNNIYIFLNPLNTSVLAYVSIFYFCHYFEDFIIKYYL